jgi:hypothetical protein
MAKSIKQRIDDLVTKLGELPPPSTATIKGNLVNIGLSVEALRGAAIRDAEAKVASLETELENLKIETEALKTEVEAFRAARTKQEKEKEREEIPDIQFEILKALPSQHGGDWLDVFVLPTPFRSK